MKSHEVLEGPPGQKSSRNLFFVILVIILLLMAAFLIIRPQGASARDVKLPASHTQQTR